MVSFSGAHQDPDKYLGLRKSREVFDTVSHSSVTTVTPSSRGSWRTRWPPLCSAVTLQSRRRGPRSLSHGTGRTRPSRALSQSGRPHSACRRQHDVGERRPRGGDVDLGRLLRHSAAACQMRFPGNDPPTVCDPSRWPSSRSRCAHHSVRPCPPSIISRCPGGAGVSYK